MLYHYKIGLPKLRLRGVLKLKYSAHAKRAACNDRYGYIQLPTAIDVANELLIEVEVLNNAVAKLVFRLQYSNQYDLCIVVNPDGLVRTVWLNSKNDTHKTLDTKKYFKPY